MISLDSPLRRYPATLNAEKAIFFDGIRHAAEMADFSYRRLCETLTSLAQIGPVMKFMTAAYIDAWSVVDSIDRFLGLAKLVPEITAAPTTPEQREHYEVTMRAIRDVRNVTDHLGQRVKYIVAKNATAQGMLHWVTWPADAEAWTAYTLRPGRLTNFIAKTDLQLPDDFVGPTAMIRIEAGEYAADLDAAYLEMRRWIRGLEMALAEEFTKSPAKAAPGASGDLLVRLTPRVVPTATDNVTSSESAVPPSPLDPGQTPPPNT
jgi:hypothetical protein